MRNKWMIFLICLMISFQGMLNISCNTLNPEKQVKKLSKYPFVKNVKGKNFNVVAHIVTPKHTIFKRLIGEDLSDELLKDSIKYYSKNNKDIKELSFSVHISPKDKSDITNYGVNNIVPVNSDEEYMKKLMFSFSQMAKIRIGNKSFTPDLCHMEKTFTMEDGATFWVTRSLSDDENNEIQKTKFIELIIEGPRSRELPFKFKWKIKEIIKGY